jgi:hypothetical protein
VAIDFEVIRAENIRKYGEDRALFDIVSEFMYSDRTHFVYELLQNAEDARATFIEYRLFEDRLEIEHDGRTFTEQDVRGICGVQSTKKGDYTAIGRFGIGFKSVHAFTETPQVHCGDLHFRIEDYVRPHEQDPLPLGPGRTRFILPFDKPEIAPDECYSEMERGLDALDDYSLLFLSSVSRIRCVNHVTDLEKVQTRKSRRDGALRRVTLELTDWHQNPTSHDWWIWSRDLADIGISGRLVEFAARVEKHPDRKRFEPTRLIDPPLVVFFPTEKPSHLGVLLQGPFRTTPARDNVPERDDTNRDIIEQAAVLLADILIDLRERRLLTAEFLESLPLDPDHFEGSPLLRPLHDAVVQAFKTNELIPTADHGHTTSERAAFASAKDLRDLLGTDQLAALLGREVEWVLPEVDAGFASFLQNVLDVPELTPVGVVGQLDAEFLQAQTAEWLRGLYEFIVERPALYRSPGQWSPPGVARVRPIIRLADGQHRLPLDDDDQPTAYLPSARPSRLPQIDPDTVSSEPAHKLLTQLGLREPDLVAELCEFTIPDYRARSFKDLDLEQHLEDVDAILEAVGGGATGSERVRRLLDEIPVIVGVGATTGRRRLCRLSEVVLDNEATRLVLGDHPDVRFVDADTYGDRQIGMSALGIQDEVVPDSREPDRWGRVVIRSWHGDHMRGLERFDPTASCSDLEFALGNPTLERSAWVWNNIAVPFRALIAGEVERATRQDYSNRHVSSEVSPFGELLRQAEWLPLGDEFVKPSRLEVDDLPPEFQRNGQLADLLEMRAGALREFSRQTSIPADLLEGLEGITDDPERLEAIRALILGGSDPVGAHGATRGDGSTDDDSDSDEPLDPHRYASEFVQAFDRAASALHSSASHDDVAPTGEVANAELRRSRVTQEIAEEMGGEPPQAQRFQPVPRRAWERKKNSTREALRELYGGQCQICTASFAKADGLPYFEGLYLVSYTRASWIDRLGNVLSLCPTCSAKFQFADVRAESVLERIRNFRLRAEGGKEEAAIPLVLAGEEVDLHFKERHIVDLQSILSFADSARAIEP